MEYVPYVHQHISMAKIPAIKINIKKHGCRLSSKNQINWQANH